jgi:response regulator RpfG family c-di-GMP phosphodiesterase
MADRLKNNLGKILVVDDERAICEVMVEYLSLEGYNVSAVNSGAEGMELLATDAFDVVLTDLEMPEVNGIELLKYISTMQRPPVPIIMTGFGTIESAIEAMKCGAYDYILKPFKIETIIYAIERAFEKRRLEDENVQLKEMIGLFHLSEALNLSLSLENILDIVIDLIDKEADADVVAIHLKDRETVRYPARVWRSLQKTDFDRLEEALRVNILLARLMRGDEIILHGSDVSRLIDVDKLDLPVTSFMSVPLISRGEVIGMICTYQFSAGHPFTEGKRKMLAILSSRAASAIENAWLYQNLQKTFTETIAALSHAIEAKDPYTRGHSERVTVFARMISRGLDLPEREVENITHASLLHDIGKIGMRAEMLSKAGKLTPEEYEVFKAHPMTGRKILEPIDFMAHIIPMVYHHHERYDGNGYPEGLAGKDIPLGARILCVADSYEVMTSDRAYRIRLSNKDAITELVRCSGSQFDPDIVDVFLRELAKVNPEAAAAVAERQKQQKAEQV